MFGHCAYIPDAVVRRHTTTLPLPSPDWTLRTLQLKEHMWFKSPTNDLASNVQTPMQKHKKHEKIRQHDSYKNQQFHVNDSKVDEIPKNSKEWL
jgi:hypothetical protein